ncbi:MAG: WD40 repeat domain-containing protein [Cyclobacteriaceae bacterium]|nr:WD40 repeat domain-containing protein [Cyclobacteriaceae bacterium]
MSKLIVSKPSVFSGHRDCVYVLESGASPNLFFSGAGDGMIVKWDFNLPDQGELIANLSNSIYALHYHQLSNTIIVGHNYDGIHVLDWQNKTEIKSLHIGNAAIFDIQSIDNTILIALGNGEVVVVDYESFAILHRFQHSNESARTIAVHPTQKEYAIGFSDATIRIYETHTHQLKKEIVAHTNSIFTLHYSPDGNKLFSSGRDAHLKIWECNHYEMIDDIVAHVYAINHIVFNPVGTHFATCSMDKTIKIWDASTHQLLKVIDKSRHDGHSSSVNKLLWTSFNNQLISASDDKFISVWDIKFL